jgi:hypothetical protein
MEVTCQFLIDLWWQETLVLLKLPVPKSVANMFCGYCANASNTQLIGTKKKCDDPSDRRDKQVVRLAFGFHPFCLLWLHCHTSNLGVEQLSPHRS